MNWRSLLVSAIGVIGLVLVMVYFSGGFHPKVGPQETVPLVVSGERIVIEPVEVGTTEPVPGTISATDETVVGSRILATITRIHVRAGDRVEQGTLLVEFDDSSQRSVLEQREQAAASARAAFDNATLNRDRAQQLIERGSVSRAEYDRAMTTYLVASAELERARRAVAEAAAQLSYTRIAAPMSGTIVDRYAEPGDTAVPGQSLLRLFNPGRLRVEAVLRESLIGQVAQGQEIGAHVDAVDVEVVAVVEEIVPSADPGSRTFLVKALLPPRENVYPGMFARLLVPTGTEARIEVPKAAVQSTGQLDFVYVDNDGTIERRVVRLGAEHADRVEIISGIGAGIVVVVPDAEEDATDGAVPEDNNFNGALRS